MPAKRACQRHTAGQRHAFNAFWDGYLKQLIFGKIKPASVLHLMALDLRLRALAPETQQFF